LITNLGYADDKRLKPALKVLNDKRQSDGTWLLDKVHPDLGAGANYDLGLKRVKPFAFRRSWKAEQVDHTHGSQSLEESRGRKLISEASKDQASIRSWIKS
jgi:hypothetical protein